LFSHTENPNDWTIDQVYQWAIDVVGISKKTAQILRDNEVDGSTLLTLTKEELLKEPYKMPGGPATKLASAIKTLKNEWAKRIACMRNTQTNKQTNKKTHLSHNI
jgi:hypothetical protein